MSEPHVDGALRAARPPVLVLAFKRPDLLRRTLAALQTAEPSAVYISVDGPRPEVAGEAEQVAAVREVASTANMACPVHLHFREKNGGLANGVIDGITWFFQHEPLGVVLEDDVEISPTSLALAGDLLTRFRDDPRVGSVTLFNAVPSHRLREPGTTYRLSRFPSSQYWATWRDRWQQLRPSVADWRESIGVDTLRSIGGQRFAHHFAEQLDEEVAAGFTAWEGLWIATHWCNDWQVVTTNANYSRHLGFNVDASNSTEQPSWYPTNAAVWDGHMVAPTSTEVDRRSDHWLVDQRFGLSWAKRTKRLIGRALPGVRSAWRRRTVQPIS